MKGIIVLGSARSGSHMVCDMLYNSSDIPNKMLLGEVTELPSIDGKFVYCSIVQTNVKNILAVNVGWMQDYHIINIRRRDKISQYISWCVFRAQMQSSISKHSPNWEDYKNLLPWESTQNDIETFISEQNLDFAFPCNEIRYYEDMINSGLQTRFRKNRYPIPHQEIVTDYALVKSMLENYSYDHR